MLGKGLLNVWVYDKNEPNAFSYHIYNNNSHGSWEVYLVCTSHFLVLLQYYSTFGGAMRLYFYENLRNYYHKNHSIGGSFHDHDHDHVLIHAYEFRTIIHLLQGMVQI